MDSKVEVFDIDISELSAVYDIVSDESDQFEILFEKVVLSVSLSPSDRPL